MRTAKIKGKYYEKQKNNYKNFGNFTGAVVRYRTERLLKQQKEIKDEKTYANELQAAGMFDNKAEEALPQTIAHKLMKEHFEAPLAQGKTTKKAILLGYDGYRADGLENIKDSAESAVMYIKSQGGLYHAFSGGIKDSETQQATSTAPSWMAILTGGWGADYNGITDNSQIKNEDAETFLTMVAKSGKPVSFTTSWREHTSLSYRPDILMSIRENLPAEYTHQPDDAGTYYQVMKYVSKPAGVEKTAKEDPDAIFFTFEHTDHAGHNTGFGNGNEEYINACKEADEWGYDIIKTIEARSTYETEDWLIVIITDHGGTETGHGGQTPFERMTWIACNKEIEMSKENLNYALKK